MSEYSEEERTFIVCTFYETGDSHSETIERFVKRFGPDKAPTGETIDRIADEFETAFKESEARNSSRTVPMNDDINQATSIPEKEPEPDHNEITERPGTSTGTHTNIKPKSDVITKRKRNESIVSPKTTRAREKQRVADLLATGLTQDEIAEKIGISKDLVSTIIAIDLAAELPARRTKKTRTSDEMNSVAVTTENKPSTTQADKAEKIEVSTSKVKITKDDHSKKQETRKTCEKNEIAGKAGPSTSTNNDNDLSERSEAPPKRSYCNLHLLKKLVESNDPKEIEELAKELGVPKECIDHVRRSIGFASHFPKK